MKRTTPKTKTARKTILVNRELTDALEHAAIGLGYERTWPAQNANEQDDRNAAKILMDLLKTLGADRRM
jgi:hypothetical protein